MKVQFKWYIHDDIDEPEYEAQDIVEIHPSIDTGDLISWFRSRPFYEVEITIEYDTETREFEVIKYER